MQKTKIAIFDLTGCDGCEFNLFSLNEILLDIFQNFEIVNWRLLKENEKKKADFDVAVIEGAVTTKAQINLLRQIRETSKIVVAMGACAISGNIFAELSPIQRKKLVAKIYNKDYKLKAKFLHPVEKYIKVDEKIQGCPANAEKFKELINKVGNAQVTSKVKEVPLPDYTAKIEGHGVLTINFKKKDAKFEVAESERLIEGLLLGKSYIQAPFITSRICGICPTAHNLCSLSAIEDAFSIQVSQETIILRQLLSAAQTIKSHILHLFFLVLPDYAGLKSSIDLSTKYPAEFHAMLNIKKVADDLLISIGGTSSFPTDTAVGGFIKAVDIKELLAVSTEISNVVDEAKDFITLFNGIKAPNLQVNTKLATITPKTKSYPFYPGTFTQTIKEVVQPHSTAKLGLLGNQVIKTGALARLNYYSDHLAPLAKKQFKNINLDLKNPFNNNTAQAIEILHLLENSMILIDKLINRNLKNSVATTERALPTKILSGQAALEAPRGILIHKVKISPQGTILSYNITPPTQLNLASLEKEVQKLIIQQKNLPQKEAKKQIQQLIRAFDPCITCAVH